MSTYTQIIYHVIFAPKNRNPCLTSKNREELYKYIGGIIKNKNCILFQIGGTDDHIHILLRLHPAVSLSSLIKDIKVASSIHIKEQRLFSSFEGWQEGYGAFTCSESEKERLVEYIVRQEEHHRELSFREEYMNFLNEHKISFNPEYLL